MKVFLIDDSKYVRNRVRMTIQDLGAEVVGEADSEIEAVSAIKKCCPDVAIIELRLREGNGLDLLKQIKRHRPETISIIFTNHSYEDYATPCHKAGADFFVEKSRHYKEFINLLNNLKAVV